MLKSAKCATAVFGLLFVSLVACALPSSVEAGVRGKLSVINNDAEDVTVTIAKEAEFINVATVRPFVLGGGGVLNSKDVEPGHNSTDTWWKVVYSTGRTRTGVAKGNIIEAILTIGPENEAPVFEIIKPAQHK